MEEIALQRPPLHNWSKTRIIRNTWTAPSWSWASLPPGQSVTFFNTNAKTGFRALLSKSIRSVNCVSKGSNDLGELIPDTGHLTLEASLFPCFVRYFCKRTGIAIKWHDRRQFGVHHLIQRPNPDAECKTSIPELDSHDGQFGLFLDIPPPYGMPFTLFADCALCSLAPIWLLHIARNTDATECRDIYMMLNQTDSSLKRYERFGVTIFEGHTVDQRNRWFKEVWENHALPNEEFTII
jgi:hypothetical protein